MGFNRHVGLIHAIATAFVFPLLLSLHKVDLVSADETEFDCVDNLEVILLTEIDIVDPSETRTYFLCPDTIYTIGHTPGSSLDPTSPGQWPLFIFRPNINVVCGPDGSSANNCIFTGEGDGAQFPSPHVVIGRPFSISGNRENVEYPGLPDIPQSDEEFDDFAFLENVFIMGITFRGVAGNNANIAVYSGTSLTIRECIFVENDTPAVIFAIDGDSATPPPFQQNVEVFLDEVRLDDAPLPPGPITMMIEDCIFQDNAGSIAGGGLSGLISSIPSPFVEISIGILRGIFVGNQYGLDLAAGEQSFLFFIGNSNSQFIMRDSCFANNAVSIGTIFANNGVEVDGSNVFLLPGESNEETCPQVAKVVTGDFLSGVADGIEFSCEELPEPADSCPLVEDQGRDDTLSPSIFGSTEPTVAGAFNPTPTSQPLTNVGTPGTASPTIAVEPTLPPTIAVESTLPPTLAGEPTSPPTLFGEPTAPPSLPGEPTSPPTLPGEPTSPPTPLVGSTTPPPTPTAIETLPPTSFGSTAAPTLSQTPGPTYAPTPTVTTFPPTPAVTTQMPTTMETTELSSSVGITFSPTSTDTIRIVETASPTLALLETSPPTIVMVETDSPFETVNTALPTAMTTTFPPTTPPEVDTLEPTMAPTLMVIPPILDPQPSQANEDNPNTTATDEDNNNKNGDNDCMDQTNARFNVKMEFKARWSCRALERADKGTQDWYCLNVAKVKRTCPQTCNRCDMFDENCNNENVGVRTVRVKRKQTCAWLAERGEARRNEICSNQQVQLECPQTCGLCEE